MLVLQQMIVFLLLMLVGIVARKQGMLTDENQPQLTKIVVNLAYPAIILSGVTGNGPHIEGMELLGAVVTVIVLLVFTMISAWLLPRILDYPEMHRGIISVMVVFTNIGFMGVPMIAGIYGQDALIYMTVFLIPFNLLFFSYAIQAIRGSHENADKFQWRSLLNPGMVACFLAIILYLANVRLPYVLAESIHMIGNMTAPLAMMLMGSFLLDVEWKDLFTDKKILLFTLWKMILIPTGIILLLEQFMDNTLMLAVCMVALATPSGNAIPLLALLYNKQVYSVSVKGIAITTLIAVITMPIVAFLTGLG